MLLNEVVNKAKTVKFGTQWDWQALIKDQTTKTSYPAYFLRKTKIWLYFVTELHYFFPAIFPYFYRKINKILLI